MCTWWVSNNHLAKVNYSPIIIQQNPKLHKSSKVMQPLEKEKKLTGKNNNNKIEPTMWKEKLCKQKFKCSFKQTNVSTILLDFPPRFIV